MSSALFTKFHCGPAVACGGVAAFTQELAKRMKSFHNTIDFSQFMLYFVAKTFFGITLWKGLCGFHSSFLRKRFGEFIVIVKSKGF